MKKHQGELIALRRHAQELLSERQAESGLPRTDDGQKLLHELQVHQIELEMQNDELRRAEVEVRASLDRYADLYDFAPVGYFTLADDGTIREVNLTGAGMLGIVRSRLEGRRFAPSVADEFRLAFNAFLAKVFEGKARESCEVALLKEGRHSFFARIDAMLSKERRECRAVVTDITERKRSEEQLRYNALHDALTGLPNRALLLNRLEHRMKLGERRKKPMFAVLFLDLDCFKLVNDSLGHTVGDRLLVEVARRLESCLRAGDTLARWGGDEFVILLEELEQLSQATVVANRINLALGTPVQLGGQEVYARASIGIVVDSPSYRQVEEMLRDSDAAMFRAKTLGGARWVVFDQEMHSAAMTRLQLENDLRRAVETEEFLVLYQPILDLATDRVAGFEALVRWQHPQRGLLAPQDFLAVAAEIGLGAEIDRYVLRRACLQTREWLAELGPLSEIVVNANLRGKSLMQPGLVEHVEEILCETGLNAHHLRLELTEADLLETATELQTVLNRLCELKVELCLDDFGTGYSSLSYLERFPITQLKIDRSFIAKACDNGKHFAIVQTIVTLAQNLGMRVIAEGVENDHQLELVRGLKCEYAQGYRISVPLDGQAAGEWLRHRRG